MSAKVASVLRSKKSCHPGLCVNRQRDGLDGRRLLYPLRQKCYREKGGTRARRDLRPLQYRHAERSLD